MGWTLSLFLPAGKGGALDEAFISGAAERLNESDWLLAGGHMGGAVRRGAMPFVTRGYICWRPEDIYVRDAKIYILGTLR